MIPSADIRVMGILNLTPDSFYSASRKQTERETALRVEEIRQQKGDIIDVGAFSTRPGFTAVDEDEEVSRLRKGLGIVRSIWPDAVVSVDTFRAGVARIAISEFGATIINDPSGVCDKRMMQVVAETQASYILTSHDDNMDGMIRMFTHKVAELRSAGVKDVIIDPGFGFGKTVDDNFQILSQLERLQELSLSVMVGFSRKSMIWKTVGGTSEDALNGTTVLNTIALMKGTTILRVHDVKEGVECVTLYKKTNDKKV